MSEYAENAIVIVFAWASIMAILLFGLDGFFVSIPLVIFCWAFSRARE